MSQVNFYQVITTSKYSRRRRDHRYLDTFVVRDGQICHLLGDGIHLSTYTALQGFLGLKHGSFLKDEVEIIDLQSPENSQQRLEIMAQLFVEYMLDEPWQLWGKTQYSEQGTHKRYTPLRLFNLARQSKQVQYRLHSVAQIMIDQKVVYRLGQHQSFYVAQLAVRAALHAGQDLSVSWDDFTTRSFVPHRPVGWSRLLLQIQ